MTNYSLDSKKEIILKEKKIFYRLKISPRARLLRLSVSREGELKVVLPAFLKETAAENFIVRQADWIFRKINYFQNKKKNSLPPASRKDYLKNKKAALEKIKSRISQINSFYGFSWKKISVRNQKTRWGSCSRSGNLSFNYRIIFLPEELGDYVIAHELCHLEEFNHSRRFWELVRKTVPEFQAARKK